MFSQLTHWLIFLKLKKRIGGKVEFVGPICESTDTFLKYEKYSFLNENDLIAITNVGAYGSSLSSNYNTLAEKTDINILNRLKEVVPDLKQRSHLYMDGDILPRIPEPYDPSNLLRYEEISQSRSIVKRL